MHSNINPHSRSQVSRVGLYTFVFASKMSLFVAFFLFVSFVIQPFHLAYANEAAAEAEAETAEETELPAEAVAAHEESSEVDAVEVVQDDNDTESVTAESTIYSETEQETQVEIVDDNTALETDSTSVDDVLTESEEVSVLPPPSEESDQVASTSASETDNDNSEAILYATTTIPSAESDQTSVSSTTDEQITDISSTTPDTATSSDSSSEVSAEPEAGSNPSDTPEAVSFEISSGGSSADSPTESDNVEAGPNEDISSTDESLVDDSIASTTATTTKPLVVNNIEYLVTEENFYQFSKQSCVSVGDGAYHCSLNENTAVDSKAIVFSELGSSGSPEIFIKTSNGEIEQITDNNFEDSSPHYDPVSQRVTWQRLIKGRYQIIIYDIKTAKEKQLTFSRTNNMEPSVSSAGVVWQAWDNNDWEIMFYDGTYTDQLTENVTQDVAPVMEDEYIIWTVIGAEEQFAQVYSFETGETVTIVNHDGGSILNPRFVLVYDTQFDNGDVITQRFDPETGFAETIASEPAEAPAEIPDADTTGEVKALIQNKSTSKQNDVVHDDNPDGSSTGTSVKDTSDTLDLFSSEIEHSPVVVATATDGTIDSAGTTTGSVAGNDVPFELTEYDLVITETHTSSSMPTHETVDVELTKSADVE